MMPVNNVAVLALASALVLTLGVTLLYYYFLPKPFPGIPYNRAAIGRLFGDAHDMKAAPRVRAWLRGQFAKHDSPIVQIFVVPFGKPWILVSDFREAQDVMLRRTADFDRSSLTTDSFGGVMPENHVCMKTSDPRFPHNRELVRDLMTPSFLSQVSAPEVYQKMALLVDLWSLKTARSRGRPFRADQDIYMAALDITMAAAFDFPRQTTMILKQIKHLQLVDEENPRASDGSSHAADTEDSSEPIVHPSVSMDPELEACVYLTESISVAFQSPVPRLAHWLYLQKSVSKRMTSLKEALIRRNIDEGLGRLQAAAGKDVKMKCAVDQVLRREKAAAEKRGMKPDYYKKAIRDEVSLTISSAKNTLMCIPANHHHVFFQLFGFIVGGHDTTSTTFAWWVKCMAKFQDAQSNLRDNLRKHYRQAREEHRLPTVEEITQTHVPYLEAVIEETFRYSHIIPIVTREAIVDTEILGHRITRGTNVIFISSAASFTEPAYIIPEEQRAPTSQKAKELFGVWNPNDVRDFLPERWLKMETVDGDEKRQVMNYRAGPQLAFGAGPRSCFGKRLAQLEMRIAVTLLVWKFEFLEMAEQLNNFEAIDSSTEMPRDCYVRLLEVPL